MWRIHPASREEGQDERQMLIRDITEAEYKALGLRFEKEKLVTDDGKKMAHRRTRMGRAS